MISIFFRIIILLAIAIFPPVATDAGSGKEKPKKLDSAMFLAPADGLFSIDAGTLEARFSLDYSLEDYLRPETSFSSLFFFLRTYNESISYVKDEAYFHIVAIQDKGIHRFSCVDNLYYREIKTDPGVRHNEACIVFDKENGLWISSGEWHSLAVTWKIEKEALHVEMFLDGKLRNTMTFPIKAGDVRPFSKGDIISIGNLDLSPATILSYRLSNRVRTREEIASALPLKPDKDTTFYLDADTAIKFKGYGREKFEKMRKSGKVDIGKGIFVGEYKIVSTPEGKAIQFYNKLSR